MTAYRGHRSARPLAAAARPPRTPEIIRVVPAGCRRIRGRHASRLYLDLVSAGLPSRLRSHARANTLAFARELAACADWQEGTTRHSRAARCARAGLSETAWKDARRRLEQAGLLRTVTPGCKHWHGDQSRSDAAVYVLICPKKLFREIAGRHRRIPRWPKTRPPTVSPSGVPETERGAARPGENRTGPPCGRALPAGGPRNAELARATRAGRAMAEAIRRGAGEGITDGWAGHLSRPFLAAGWTGTDMARALERTPAGTTWAAIASGLARAGLRLTAVAWTRWKLAHWLDPGGRAAASPSARDTAAAAARHEPLRARNRAPGTDPAPHVQAILDQQGWRRPPAIRPGGKSPPEGNP